MTMTSLIPRWRHWFRGLKVSQISVLCFRYIKTNFSGSKRKNFQGMYFQKMCYRLSTIQCVQYCLVFVWPLPVTFWVVNARKGTKFRSKTPNWVTDLIGGEPSNPFQRGKADVKPIWWLTVSLPNCDKVFDDVPDHIQQLKSVLTFLLREAM